MKGSGLNPELSWDANPHFPQVSTSDPLERAPTFMQGTVILSGGDSQTAEDAAFVRGCSLGNYCQWMPLQGTLEFFKKKSRLNLDQTELGLKSLREILDGLNKEADVECLGNLE